MNLNFQNKLLKYSLIICFSLFLVIILLFNKKTSSYKEEISSLEKQNSRLEQNIKKAFNVINKNAEIRMKEIEFKDSLSNRVAELSAKILLKNKQLSDIQKNNYKGISLDSLLKIAQQRYEKDKHISPTINK